MDTTERIAFPSLNGTKITGHFGRLKHFIVVEIADGKEVGRSQRDRDERVGHQDEAGARPHHKTLLELITDCQVVVAGGMGFPMVENLSNQGIQLVLTSERDIDHALELYLSGELVHDASRAHAHDEHGKH